MASYLLSRTVTPDHASVPEVAVLLGRHRSTVWQWVRDGKLPSRRDPSGDILIPLAAIDQWPSAARED